MGSWSALGYVTVSVGGCGVLSPQPVWPRQSQGPDSSSGWLVANCQCFWVWIDNALGRTGHEATQSVPRGALSADKGTLAPYVSLECTEASQEPRHTSHPNLSPHNATRSRSRMKLATYIKENAPPRGSGGRRCRDRSRGGPAAEWCGGSGVGRNGAIVVRGRPQRTGRGPGGGDVGPDPGIGRPPAGLG